MPAGTTVEDDLSYGRDSKQKLDVYLPRHSEGPVVLMVHGGAWTTGDKAEDAVVNNKVAWLLPKGIIFISVNYRLLPDADTLEQANDVAQALALAQMRARSWGGDPSRFVLMGHSAGAHLVSLLTADPRIAAKQRAKPWLGTVSLDGAAYDVVDIMQNRHYPAYDDAFGDDPSHWREASPLYRLFGQGAPMFAVCSARHELSCSQSRKFASASTRNGRTVNVFPVDLRHGEIDEYLGLPGEYTTAVEGFLQSLRVM